MNKESKDKIKKHIKELKHIRNSLYKPMDDISDFTEFLIYKCIHKLNLSMSLLYATLASLKQQENMKKQIQEQLEKDFKN